MIVGLGETLCALYGLGTPRAALAPVPGGLLHKTYRLTTTRGEYAVKALNPQLLRQPGSREQFRRSERIAAALAAGGIPAVVALDSPDGTVPEVCGEALVVYPWCEGVALPPGPSHPSQARQIGTLLGRIHALDLWPAMAAAASFPDPFPDDHWRALSLRAGAEEAAWAGALEAALPAIFGWGRQAAAADKALTERWVVSHRDLDQKNVLWRDPETPAIIDWEAAGPVSPALDVLAAAVNWSGQSAGLPDRAAFEAVLDGYRQVRAFPAAAARPALECRLAAWLKWLEFNVCRALGEGAADAAEEALGASEVANSLSTLFSLSEGIPTWSEWC